MSRDFDPHRDHLPPGISLVEAGAGTGKTWSLVHLVLGALLRGEVEPAEVLVVTFTNAATDELSARLRRLLRECGMVLGLEPAVGDCADARALLAACGEANALRRRLHQLRDAFDRLGVRTIHGFCAEVLAQEAFAAGLPQQLDLLSDSRPLVEEAARAAWRSLAERTPLLGALLTCCEKSWQPLQRRRIEQAARLALGRQGVGFDPAPGGFAAAAAEVRQAHAVLADVWQPSHAAWLRSLPWKKALAPATLDRMEAFVAGREDLPPEDQAQLLRLFSVEVGDPEKFLLLKNNSKKALAGVEGHPLVEALRACEAAAQALVECFASDLLADAGRRLEERCRRDRLRTQDGLLADLHRALHDPQLGDGLAQRLAARWQLVCVDEFQDTDGLQWGIFRRAFARPPGRLVLIGDPKQAIYGFRGADVRVYTAARGEAATRHSLGTNRRSAPGIVAAVEALFSRSGAPFGDPAIAFAPSRAAGGLELVDPGAAPGAFQLWLDEGDLTPERAVAGVSAEAARLLDPRGAARLVQDGEERVLVPGDCCVLVRSGQQAAAILAALQEQGIPAALAASGDVLEGEEARELGLLLAAVLQPGDAQAVRLALATRLWGEDAAGLRAINTDPGRWEGVLAHLGEAAALWRRRGVAAAIQALLHGRGALPRLASQPGGERAIANLRHLTELLQGASRGRSPEALLAWLRDPGRPDGDERELRLESDAGKVRVITMHRAKGLQFPVVFCPFLWNDGPRCDNREPELLPADGGEPWQLVLDPARADQARRARHHVGESARLAYVALTRAQARCYCLWGAGDGTDKHGKANANSTRSDCAKAALSGLGWQLLGGGGAVPADADLVLWMDADGPALQQVRQRCAEGAAAWAAAGCRVSPLPAPLAARRAPAAAPLPPFPVAAPPADLGRRLVEERRRLFSFSGLVHGAAEPPPAREPEAPAPPVAAEDEGPLAGFAAGADAGDCLHDLIEGWLEDPAGLDLAGALQRAGFGPDSPRHRPGCRSVEQVRSLLDLLGGLPLLPAAGGTPLRLGACPPLRRRAEWDFHLPLAGLRVADLVAAVREHDPALWQRLGPGLQRLEDRPLQGLLRGYVDLLLEHEGRWHVLDWKSNRLGAAADAFAPEALWRSLDEDHYGLQALLYLSAVDRWLMGWKTDYDPGLHLGNAWYVYLRGLRAGSAAGVATLAPGTGLVLALRRLAGVAA